MRNYLVSDYAGIASNCELARAIKRRTNLRVVYRRKDPYQLDNIVRATYSTNFNHLPKRGDNLVIVSTPTLRALLNKRGRKWFKNWKKIIIIISDGWYMHSWGKGKIVYDDFNKLFKSLGIEVWVTHDKLQFRKGLPTFDFYQPFDFSGFRTKKNKKITISHSPFKGREKTKGTNAITKQVIKYKNVKWDIITGVNWKRCMTRKARSHIFIDQIKSDKPIHNKLGWIGGIGKSGFEAMGLGSVLICRGKFEGLNIPAPPVCWTEDKSLAEWLSILINNPNIREQYRKKQQNWFNKYCSPNYQAMRIIKRFV